MFENALVHKCVPLSVLMLGWYGTGSSDSFFLLQEVNSMFDSLYNQLSGLRVLVSSADPKTGKPHSIGSPTRGRSKSVAVVHDDAAAEPSPHLRQAERLFDLWQERMEEDQAELQEAMRAVSSTVGTVCGPTRADLMHRPQLMLSHHFHFEYIRYSAPA